MMGFEVKFGLFCVELHSIFLRNPLWENFLDTFLMTSSKSSDPPAFVSAVELRSALHRLSAALLRLLRLST